MEKSEIIDALVADESSAYTEDDREQLDVMRDDSVTHLHGQHTRNVAAAAAQKAFNTATPNQSDEDEESVSDDSSESIDTEVTTQQYIEMAPVELRDPLREILSVHNERKQMLISAITANKHNTFGMDTLATMGVSTLESIAAMAGTEKVKTFKRPDGGDGSLIGKEEALEMPTVHWSKN